MPTNVAEAMETLAGLPQEAASEGSHPAERPDRLYHFTTCRGLLGVLQGRRLRASLATSLNDQSEIWYGVQRARLVLPQLDAPAGFRDALAEQIEELTGEAAAQDARWRVYLVSFCAHADKAPHWLHYGRSGTGVAIGFDARVLERPHFNLYPVLYDAEQQDALLRRTFEGAWKRIEQAVPAQPAREQREFLREAAAAVAPYLWLVAPRIKSPAFEAEDEWRLIAFEPRHHPPGSMQPLRTYFRTVAGRVVPYKVVQYEPLPVCDILLGASAPMQPHDQALAVLAEESTGRRLPITRSEVPVRQ